MHCHFKVKIKQGKRRGDWDCHQNSARHKHPHQAGRLRRSTFTLSRTFSLTQEKCSAKRNSASHEHTKGDPSGFVGCFPGLWYRLPFHHDGMGCVHSQSLVLFHCRFIRSSTTQKLHPPALLLLPSI